MSSSSKAIFRLLFGIPVLIMMILVWVFVPGRTSSKRPWQAPAKPVYDIGAMEGVLVGAGDIGDCIGGMPNPANVATAKLLDDVKGTVFTLGDNAYVKGTTEEYATCYAPTWGRHLERTRPAVGNHDYLTEGAAPYYAYFGERAGPPGRGYYSYDVGLSWHIVVLNSNCKQAGGCDEGSPQLEWLKKDLSAHSRPCTLAYFHHPRFSSGRHGNDDAYVGFWQVLSNHRAELVIAGHDHHYERFAPQRADGELDAVAGIRQFVVGTGGRLLYPLRELDDETQHSEVRDNNTYGVLKVSLFQKGYEWEFIPARIPTSGGAPAKPFSDAGRVRCH